VRTGGDVCLIGVGTMLDVVERAAAALAEEGIECTVWDPRSCAPLDPEMIAEAAGFDRVVTLEDGVRAGGIGMTIADAVCALETTTRVDVLGLPTRFLPHDPKPANIHARSGLDVDSLVELVRAG
jgi:1-deoxy-D-xylulose-5-phosphate synthase